MYFRRRYLLALLALTALACRSPEEGPSEKTPRRETSSPESPPRLVSLTPAITETLLTLGAAEQVVGISDYCRQLDRPRVGSSITPNLEAIAALRPTSIVSMEVAGAQNTELARLAPTVQLPWLTLSEVSSSVRRLGEVTGRTEEALRLSQRLSTGLGKAAPEDAPKVLLLIGSSDEIGSQLWYIRPESLHGKLLEAAGYRNAAPVGRSGPPNLSFEGVLSLQPEAILVLRNEEKDSAVEARLLEGLQKLAPLEAVKNKRVGVLSIDGSLGVGPGILKLLPPLQDELRRLLDPDGATSR